MCWVSALVTELARGRTQRPRVKTPEVVTQCFKASSTKYTGEYLLTYFIHGYGCVRVNNGCVRVNKYVRVYTQHLSALALSAFGAQ